VVVATGQVKGSYWTELVRRLDTGEPIVEAWEQCGTGAVVCFAHPDARAAG